MVRKYIETEQTIILNVVDCSQDTHNSAAFSMTESVDPHWERTLLVFTKVDNVRSDGTVVEKFQHVQRDFNIRPSRVFFVKNRSKEDIKNSMTLQESKQDEAEYFAKRMIGFQNAIPHKCLGSKQVANKCHDLLIEALLKSVPQWRDALTVKENMLKDSLKKLGKPLQGTFVQSIEDMMSGTRNTVHLPGTANNDIAPTLINQMLAGLDVHCNGMVYATEITFCL